VDLPIEEFMVPLTTMVRSRFITARSVARHMIKQHSGVIIFVTGSPARPHVPGVTAIGAAFGAIENLTGNLAFEVSPFGIRVVCLRTSANNDSRSIQDTMAFLAGQIKITKDQAMAQIAQSRTSALQRRIGICQKASARLSETITTHLEKGTSIR
jgi:NAD(P)-dependent dehydrogenase (short-subunit alcohol dehydrogenase family)